MSELIGQRIKDYEILESIGEGGMGAVYRARQLSVERDVVVKVIREQYARNEDFIRNFEYEASIIANLESPYIVPLYDFWRESGGAYMIMRYMRGGSVRDELKESWDSSNVAELLNLVARALMTAHGRGVVHRDIKPDNILLDDNGEAFLADFGLASDTRLGVEGRGYTPAYAAPEQIRREQVTPQTDIYSLGIVLYELLTGSRPFTDSTISDLESRHINEPLPAVTETRPDVPHEVDDVISKATDKDPLNRYTTSLQLSEAFARALRGEVGSAPSVQVEATVFNPYKGLEPFDYGDRHNFFGRDALTTRLVNRLRNTRFLAVVGPSGSGKSSVVKAGVIPSLKQGDITNSNRWYIGSMTPGNNAFANLAQELRGVLNDPPPGLENQLRADETALGTLVKDLLPGDESAELLLFIDQFEEMFTLNGDDRTVFLNNLYHAVNDPEARLRIVITLRADFYDRPLQVPNFGELVRENLETVVAPNRSELEEAIVRPSERVAVTLEPDLVNQIINDVGDQPGMLPLLQYALRELFNQATTRTLTLRNYRDIGGVAGALARNAEELYTGLSAEQQISARDLFLSLVSVNEDMEATRRRILRTDLSRDDNTQMVLDHFGAARLLTFDNDPETRVPTVEIAHEALIRTWDTLRDWIDNNRDALRIQRQLQTDTRIWRENGLADDFLAQAGPLSLYRDLMESDVLPISPEEKTFIDTSIRKREEEQLARTRELEERLRLAEESERQKEQLLEQEQAATERQRQNLQRLQILVGVAALLFVIALVFAIVAFFQGQRAQDNAADAIAQGQLAQDNAAIAQANANEAATQEQAARNNAEVANTAAAEAALAQGVAEAGITDVFLANATSFFQSTEVAAQASTATVAQGEAEINAVTANAASTAAIFNQVNAEANATQAANANSTAIAERDRAEDQEETAVAAAEDAQQQREIAEANATLANEQRQAAVANATEASVQGNQSLSRSLAGQAELLFNAGDYSLAAMLAYAASEVDGAPDDVQRVLSLIVYNGPRDIIEPDQLGDQVRVVTHCNGNMFVTGDADGRIRYWQIDDGLILNDSESWHTAAVTAIACSADGDIVVSGDIYGNIIVWVVSGRSLVYQRTLSLNNEEVMPTPTETNIRETRDENHVLTLAFYPDEPQYIVAGYLRVDEDGEELLLLWDTSDENAEEIPIIGHSDGVSGAIFVENGNKLISTALDGELILWDTSRLANEGEFDILRREQYPAGITALVLSPSEEEFATAGVDGIVIEWDVATLQILGRMVGHAASINDIDYATASENEVFIVSASDDRNAILWDTNTYRELRRLRAHGQAVTGVAFSANSDYIVSTSTDRQIMLWDHAGGAEAGQLFVPNVALQNGLDIGSESAVTTSGLDLFLWNTSSGLALEDISFVATSPYLHEGTITSIAVSPVDDYVVSGDAAGYVVLWSRNTGTSYDRIRHNNDEDNRSYPIASIAFSTTGEVIATGSTDRVIRLWDVERGVETGSLALSDSDELAGNTGEIQALAFCCDDVLPLDDIRRQFLASGSTGGELFVWNWMTGNFQPLAIEDEEFPPAITAISFSPTGDLLVAARADNTLTLWRYNEESEEYEFQDTLRQHTAPVRSVDFSPDGTMIISASEDRTVIVWRVDWSRVTDNPDASVIASPIQALIGHTSAVNSVRFVSDERALSSGDDGRIILWEVQDREDLILWIAEHRDIPGNCEQREEFGLAPCVENEEGIPVTPTSIPTATPTASPIVTATATIESIAEPPPATATVERAETESARNYYATAESASIIDEEFGYEAERRALDVIDVSFESNLMRWNRFDNVYGNFMFRTTIDWSVGSLQDRCGVIIRMQDRDNFHVIQLDQLSNVYYIQRSEGAWDDEEEAFTNPGFVEQLPVDVDLSATTVDLTVIVEENETRIFIDNDFTTPIFVDREGVSRIDYDDLEEGFVALVATVFETSREAACIFKDSWIVDLDRTDIPTMTPLPPTLMPLAIPASTTLQGAEEIVPELWERLDLAELIGLDASGEREDGISGYVSEQASRLLIDVSGFENVIEFTPVEEYQEYSNFIVGTYFTMQSDADDDACGIAFRYINNQSYYFVDVNPSGQVTFNKNDFNDGFQNDELGSVTLNPERNQLLIVGIDITEDDRLPESRFIIFINGQNVGEVRDGSNARGLIALLASIGQESASAGCIFERSWVWNLDLASPPPRPTPLPTVAANNGENELLLEQPVTSNLMLGEQEFWTFNIANVDEQLFILEEDGTLVLPVVITVDAMRPANGADVVESTARQLLDIELRVIYIDDEGNETFVDYSGDIVPGQQTNVRLAIQLGVEENEESGGYRGQYRFEVYSVDDATGGDYTISIEPGEAQ